MIERYSRPAMKRIWSDETRFERWLEVEIAVCEAWAEMGAIPRSAVARIKLARIDPERMADILRETHHDMTAFLGAVSETIGSEARFIHMGLTSSDVMDTALGLQLNEAAGLLDSGIKGLVAALADKAMRHKYTPMAGRTHGVHAEPTSFGLKMALWVEEMNRNRHRLHEAWADVAVGKISGAVGTYATVSPALEEKACARLGLTPDPASSQIVQRDRHARFVATLAVIASSLEKFATEIRALQRTEVREAEEPFAARQTGSSAMPHKRNPELCERICGIARLVRGYSTAAMENIALWHERDISHSSAERIILPDACLVVDYALAVFTEVITGLQVFPRRMKRNLEMTRGLLFSQRVMLALIDKGMSRQDAYRLVQRNAMKSWRGGKRFISLLKGDGDVMAVLTEKELEPLFDVQYYLRHVDDIFERLGLTEAQWKSGGGSLDGGRLAPRSI